MALSESGQSTSRFPLNLYYRTATIEVVIPIFAGVLLSLILCAAIGLILDMYDKADPVYVIIEVVIEEAEEEDEPLVLSVTDEFTDTILSYFRSPDFKEWVVDFFTGICFDRAVAQSILDNSDRFNIPPALAFALSWEESRFNPLAVGNNRDGSIDRGLFQLNSRSFPSLELAAFFNVESNSYYGLGHLRYCLDSGGTEVSALAMYNAGTGRVRSTGAPEVTLNYISRILDNRRKMENQFFAKLAKEEEIYSESIL